jgi:tRNA(Arg) A34 adenosine deaminase TadA
MLTLPDWAQVIADAPPTLADEHERLRFVIELSRRNVDAGSGGPFGAAVFEEDGGRLVALGVNRVEALGLSAAHAEVVALSLAQQALGSYDLGASGLPRHTLVSSAQPCLMCLGATLWSGVTRLVYGATKRDVEKLCGFDEGFLPSHWASRLKRRGLAVAGGLLRQEARAVLRLYREGGGRIYNARRAAQRP